MCTKYSSLLGLPPETALACLIRALISCVLSHSLAPQVSETGDLLNLLVASTQVCQQLTIFANNHCFGLADIFVRFCPQPYPAPPANHQHFPLAEPFSFTQVICYFSVNNNFLPCFGQNLLKVHVLKMFKSSGKMTHSCLTYTRLIHYQVSKT